MRGSGLWWLAVVSLGACDSTTDPAAGSPRGASDADSARDASPVDRDAGERDGGRADAGSHDGRGRDAGEVQAIAYAIRTVIDVTWQDELQPPAYDSGTGTIVLLQRLTTASACDDGELDADELEPCVMELPAYTSTAYCAAYQLEMAERSTLRLDGETDVELFLGNVGMTYRETGCGFGLDRPLVFHGLPAVSPTNILCDPSAEPARGGCPEAGALVVAIDAAVSVAPEQRLCGGADAPVGDAIEVTALALRLESCVLRDGTPCSDRNRDYAAAFLPAYTVTDVRSELVPLGESAAQDCAGVRRAVVSGLSP